MNIIFLTVGLFLLLPFVLITVSKKYNKMPVVDLVQPPSSFNYSTNTIDLSTAQALVFTPSSVNVTSLLDPEPSFSSFKVVAPDPETIRVVTLSAVPIPLENKIVVKQTNVKKGGRPKKKKS